MSMKELHWYNIAKATSQKRLQVSLKSKGDEKQSIEQYFEKIRLYLGKIIDDLGASGESKTSPNDEKWLRVIKR